MDKPFIGAAERNKKFILEELKELFSGYKTVLEVGSGTGQHAVYFAPELQHLEWQPSDLLDRLPGISVWREEFPAKNVRNPIELDIRNWPDFKEKYDAIFASNVIHYIEEKHDLEFFRESERMLLSNGVLVLYGPFKTENRYSSSGDIQLDLMLKSENELFGIRNIEKLERVAFECGLELERIVSLPANNKLICFRKKKEP